MGDVAVAAVVFVLVVDVFDVDVFDVDVLDAVLTTGVVGVVTAGADPPLLGGLELFDAHLIAHFVPC